MKIFKLIAVVLLVIVYCGKVDARIRHIFYDSKSNLIGITGDYNALSNHRFTVKFLNNPVELPYVEGSAEYNGKKVEKLFNSENVGKKILDYLFQFNGTTLSEDTLKQRAIMNAQSADEERAEIGVLDKKTILSEDYLPLLQNNFIFLERSGGKNNTYWIVLKVEIDKEILNEVYNCWNSPDKYNQIKVPVKYIASGKFKYNPISTFNMYSSGTSKFLRHVSKQVPEFAIRGQVVDRSPFTVNIGLANGIKRGDRIRIYRQAMKDSIMYSKRVSVVRVGKTDRNQAHLYTLAGGQASYKKGDAAVLEPDKNMSLSVTPWYQDHSYGMDLRYEWRMNFASNGLSTYFILQAGGGVYEKFNNRLYVFNGPSVFYAPVIANGGFGFGLGYHVAHALEIEPYFMGQYEGLFLKNEPLNMENESYNPSPDDTYTKDFTVTSIRIPVGVKVNINVWYPVQLTLGADYNFNIKIDDKDAGEASYSRVQQYFFDQTGFKREGLKFYAGLRFNF